MKDFFKITSTPTRVQQGIMVGGGDTTENELKDRISSLPDSILLHILSFLPMKEAVKTILLRRFGNLWTSMQTLDFDARSYNNILSAHHNAWLKMFMNHALLRHECPTIFKFSLKFGSYLYFSPEDIGPHWRQRPLGREFSNNIDSWIHFAVRKKVKVLNLGILAYEASSSRFDYDLPDDVLTYDSLKELKLVNIGFKQKVQIHMKSLKTLSLTTIMLDDRMIEGILSGCPSLETLSIFKCYGLRKLNCMCVNLKNLTVDVGDYELPGLEISGPNLMSLHISGMEAPMDLKNLSSLVEATLDLHFGGEHKDKYSYFGALLEKLYHANTFTIYNSCILVLSFWNLKGIPCPSSSRKCMILKTMLTKQHVPGITNLLKNSPNLERLSIYIKEPRLPGEFGEYYWNTEAWLQEYKFDEEKYLKSPEPFNCLINHLKIVKIFGSISNPYLQALIEFLLRRSNVLEEMVISDHSCHSISKDIPEFSQKLSRCPKASDRAAIMFT